MTFDVAAALRWMRFDPGRTLARRPDVELPFVDQVDATGPALLLDTCVYIDQMRGSLPERLEFNVVKRRIAHSTVAIQELMHSIGVLRPDDPRTATVIREVGRQITAMQPHRIAVPDTEILGRAALLSGILCRLQGYAHDRRLRALQDCTLFLQAQKLGAVVLTRNVADFDLLLQLIPAGRVFLYRTA